MRLLLLITLALAGFLHAQETIIREVYDPATDTHVEVLALFTKPSSGGFFPVRVTLANNTKKQGSIELRFNASNGYGDNLTSRSSFGITAKPGKTVSRDFMVPLCSNAAGYNSQIQLNASLTGTWGDASGYVHSNREPSHPSVLMSEALFTPNASQLDAALKKSLSSRYGSSDFAGKFNPKQLPDNWLAFSGYDSLLMTDTDWSDVPPGARNAILSWVSLGGQLVIYSSSNPTPASLGLPADPGFGCFHIRSVPSDLMLQAAQTISLVTSGNPVPTRAASTRDDYSSSWPLQHAFGGKAFNYGIFIIVLIVFGILVGPVNLFVFAKSGRRHRLFVTTPLISLGASIILIALIIFQDGFGGNGIRRVLMEVNPESGTNAAFIHQEQFARTGILTNTRFTIDPASFLTPAPIANSRWARFTKRSATGTFNLQPDGGKMNATGDWFQSRSEHGHTLTAVVPTRGRIERTATPGTMVSTFDFPIETLYFLDEAQQWHRAESITTGTPFKLVPIDATMASPALANEANAFANRNRYFFNQAKNRPDHYIAITTAAPAINTHPGIDWQETQTIITGPVLTP